jgi:hypothetical protein
MMYLLIIGDLVVHFEPETKPEYRTSYKGFQGIFRAAFERD